MRTEDRSIAAAVGVIAATYTYFLIFAQFGFLDQVRAVAGTPRMVQAIMGLMALCGMGASLFASWQLRRWDSVRMTRVGFIACSLAALAAPICQRPLPVALVALAIGGAMGWLTVCLAVALRQLVPDGWLGRSAGLGTGAAYIVSNIPAVFGGTPGQKALLAAALAGCGLLFLAAHPGHALPSPYVTRNHGRWPAFLPLLLAMTALVWYDSAAFAVIQQHAELKGLSWGSPLQQVQQGLIHCAAAIVAGILFDRGHLAGILMASYGFFLGGSLLLSNGADLHHLSGGSYAVGVALYTTILVAYPGQKGWDHERMPARWRAGLLFAVAGWFGSANGIGMATQLHRLPLFFLIVTGAVVIGNWLWAAVNTNQALLSLFLRPASLIVIMTLGWCIGWKLEDQAHLQLEAGADAVAAGRRVYISEGCMHCHSQYVRPRSDDVLLWGPVQPVDRSQAPPLIGNRRQGPDLLNVGPRRSIAWHRRHLIAPQEVSPGSRMPSYAHLFSGDNERGEHLVAYLASLGSALAGQRIEQELAWHLPAEVSGDFMAGEHLYQRNCAQCHGVEGKGGGPVAPYLATQPPALQNAELRYAPAVMPSLLRRQQLARIIRFGIHGTDMPGHEYLEEEQIAALVDYLVHLNPGRESHGIQ